MQPPLGVRWPGQGWVVDEVGGGGGGAVVVVVVVVDEPVVGGLVVVVVDEPVVGGLVVVVVDEPTVGGRVVVVVVDVVLDVVVDAVVDVVDDSGSGSSDGTQSPYTWSKKKKRRGWFTARAGKHTRSVNCEVLAVPVGAHRTAGSSTRTETLLPTVTGNGGVNRGEVRDG
jgi:hypothetical protein